jgi:glycine/D-amino acid oxidase-like deaminating enzyme
VTVTIKKERKPKKVPKTGAEKFEAYKREGFRDAHNGVFHPEAYAKGMARRAYTLGKTQWVERMAKEK